MRYRVLVQWLMACVVGGMVALAGVGAASAQGADFCWKDTATRGVGVIPPTCAPGQVRLGVLCYDECPAGMARYGFDCHSVCPEGMENQGLFCRAAEYGRGVGYGWQWGDPAFSSSGQFARCEADNGSGGCEQWGAVVYPKCRPGYEAFGCCLCRPRVPNCQALGLNPGIDLSCAKRVEVGTPETGVCAPGQVMDAGLCYDACSSGYDGVGPVCWGSEPEGWVDCGMGAARDDATCAEIVVDQVLAVGQTAAFFATAGTSGAGTAAAGAARGAGRLAQLRAQYERMRRAWNAVERTPVVQAALQAAEAADVVESGIGIAQEAQAATTEEDMARVAAQIAAILDPSGVAGTVAAYTYPTCSRMLAGVEGTSGGDGQGGGASGGAGASGEMPGWQQPPSVGTITLAAGFSSDPRIQSVVAGGSIANPIEGAACRGYLPSRPTAVVAYTAGRYALTLSAASDTDLTLVVRDPAGRYLCDDDSGEGNRPRIDVERPASGAYTIWVGTYSASAGTVGSRLGISEIGAEAQ